MLIQIICQRPDSARGVCQLTQRLLQISVRRSARPTHLLPRSGTRSFDLSCGGAETLCGVMETVNSGRYLWAGSIQCLLELRGHVVDVRQTLPQLGRMGDGTQVCRN